ncbi:hypothetical protein ACI2IP_13320 [Microbacterium sp. NPDC090218]
MERLPDFDELIAWGEVDASPEERKRAALRVLWREAEAAISADIEYTIEIAAAASAVFRGETLPVPAAAQARRAKNISRAQLARRAREAREVPKAT